MSESSKQFNGYSEQEPSVLKEKDFQDFIEFRKIKPEDFRLIEEMSHFPKDLFIEFHNFFNLLKEQSLKTLENQLRNSVDGEQKKILGLLFEFAKKYDWT